MSNSDFADFINQLFVSLDTKDSILILLFLLGAFLIGWIARWLSSRRKINRLKKSLKQKESSLITTKANYEALQEQFETKDQELEANLSQMEELRDTALELEAEKAQLQSDLYTTKDQLKSVQTGDYTDYTNTDSEAGDLPQPTKADLQLLQARLKNLQLEKEDLLGINEQLEAENETLKIELQIKKSGGNGSLPIFVDETENGDSTDEPITANAFLSSFRKQANQLNLIESKLRYLENENNSLQQKIQFIHQHDPEAMTVLLEEEEEEVQESAADLKSIQARQAISAALGQKIDRASENDKNDLKKINGIGPFIEEQLNSIGIYTYRQISQFDDALIEQITDAIQFFPGRIKRDDWTGQARRLANS